jgi:uncharacterized damage-inducible protein DinB
MSPLAIPRPANDEYAPFYAGYIAKVPGDDALPALAAQERETAALLAGLSEEQAAFRYAPGKWSVKQVAAHLCDAERVFAYRALRIARGDATPLAGFDENAYAAQAGADARPLAEIASELGAVRAATLALFRGLEPATLTRRGTANNVPVSVRAAAWIIAGHERHHLGILRERYLA